MNNPELQILVHGKDIAHSQVQLDYPDVKIKEVVKPENPNYLFIYLEIGKSARPGRLNLVFTEGKKKIIQSYKLKERSQTVGAQGFNASDVLYLIMPDRFANGDAKNDTLDDANIDRHNPDARHGGDLAGISNKLDYLSDLGVTAIWLNPVLENKMPEKKYRSYHGYAVPDIHAPQSEVNALTEGWFTEAMPDLNQKNPLLATYLIQNSIWWIEYARIDGIRHDTHPYVDYDFLSKWCKAVLDEYPDFNMVGESWYLNSAPLAWWQRNSKISGRQSNLKTTMDFNLMNACQEMNLRQIYEVIAQDFLYEDVNNILIFLDNHDLSRFTKANETDLNRYKQAIAFLLTTRGIPQIYYGTEILMTGEKSDGDGGLRNDFPGGWATDTRNAFTPAGRTAQQNEAFNYLQKLLQWRKTNQAVTEGKLIHYAPNEWQENVYVYARVKDAQKVLVILNGSEKEQALSPAKYYEIIGKAVAGKDIISGKTIALNRDIVVPAKGVYILELN
ncbi:hypothetical protein FACS1894176_02870 [Bacteroidia bacterium]|nr:hypothetical protein FACS1894176_02870 [Bacteroidia bacterium]